MIIVSKVYDFLFMQTALSIIDFEDVRVTLITKVCTGFESECHPQGQGFFCRFPRSQTNDESLKS